MTGKKSTRPNNIPLNSPLYKTEVSFCGDNMIQMKTSRPLDPTGHPLSQGHEEVLRIGEPI
jgi:hypothetical protein